MNKATLKAFIQAKIPSQKIQDIIQACGDDFLALRMQRVYTESTKHGKEGHGAFKTRYNTTFSGLPCEYQYSYCPDCNARYGFKSVLFDDNENTAYVFKHEANR